MKNKDFIIITIYILLLILLMIFYKLYKYKKKDLEKANHEIDSLKKNLDDALHCPKEYSGGLKRLEDMGFISCHGFLKPETKNTWEKWAEENVGKFERTNILTKKELYNQMKVTQIDPVEAEYYRQVDKAIKDTKE